MTGFAGTPVTSERFFSEQAPALLEEILVRLAAGRLDGEEEGRNDNQEAAQ